MGTNLNRSSYVKLIEEDIAALNARDWTGDRLEKEHIEHVLTYSVACHYPQPGKGDFGVVTEQGGFISYVQRRSLAECREQQEMEKSRGKFSEVVRIVPPPGESLPSGSEAPENQEMPATAQDMARLRVQRDSAILLLWQFVHDRGMVLHSTLHKNADPRDLFKEFLEEHKLEVVDNPLYADDYRDGKPTGKQYQIGRQFVTVNEKG